MAERTTDSHSPDPAPEDVVEHFRLDADEDLALSAWHYRMMQRDIAATRGKSLVVKREARDEFRNRAVEIIEIEDPSAYRTQQAQMLAASIRGNGPAARSKSFQVLETAGPELTEVITERTRAMLLLIDLYGFEPWPRTTWVKDVRRKALVNFRDTLSPLREEDLTAVSSAYDKSIKALSVKSQRWGRVALFGAAGLGLGVLTAGLAAPAVGALYGSAVLGYSGAVATNAGLAALGGGSLASGGLGMAGGTALIAGAGGAAGMAVVSSGAHAAGFTAGQVAADVVRLEVATQLVLRDIEGDERAAKAVVLALREKMLALRDSVVELSRRIEELKAERDAALAALKEERQVRAANENTIRQLRAQLDSRLHRNDQGALQSVDEELKRLRQQKRASKVVCEFVESRADVLDKAA